MVLQKFAHRLPIIVNDNIKILQIHTCNSHGSIDYNKKYRCIERMIYIHFCIIWSLTEVYTRHLDVEGRRKITIRF